MTEAAGLRIVARHRAIARHRVVLAAVPTSWPPVSRRRTGHDHETAVETVDVAVIGGGVAGATVARLLARAGVDVVVLERAPVWRWRAGGVFASPATVAAAASTRRRRRHSWHGSRGPSPRCGSRPRAARRSTSRTATETGGPGAVGMDRSALDPALLEAAVAAGARLRTGVAVTDLVLPPADGSAGTVPAELTLAGAPGPSRLRARIVVGRRRASLDRGAVGRRGPSQPLAAEDRLELSPRRPAPGWQRDASAAAGRRRRLRRDRPRSGRPGQRRDRARSDLATRLAGDGAAAVADAVLRSRARDRGRPDPLARRAPCDPIAGAVPLGHRVTAGPGPGWLVVGDAAGFLDPFTGEGLHRAFVSAALAAARSPAALTRTAVAARTTGRCAGDSPRRTPCRGCVQAFLARPVVLEYAARRLADRPAVRATMGLVMGDLAPSVTRPRSALPRRAAAP